MTVVGRAMVAVVAGVRDVDRHERQSDCGECGEFAHAVYLLPVLEVEILEGLGRMPVAGNRFGHVTAGSGELALRGPDRGQVTGGLHPRERLLRRIERGRRLVEAALCNE